MLHAGCQHRRKHPCIPPSPPYPGACTSIQLQELSVSQPRGPWGWWGMLHLELLGKRPLRGQWEGRAMQEGLLLYQLSLPEKTISVLAGQCLNKDELLGESSGTRYCAIYHNKYDGLLLALPYLINPLQHLVLGATCCSVGWGPGGIQQQKVPAHRACPDDGVTAD